MNERMRDWAGPTLIGLTGLAFTLWTWGKWPDAQIDFGRELYVPWQLSEGRTLYADLPYFNGPLSPAVNALCFRLMGPSLQALVLLNLAVTMAIAAMVHILVRHLAGRFAAAIAGLAFVVFFAFAQFMPGGSYNYLAPYSHEATHGLALSIASLVCFGAYVRGGRAAWAAGCGVTAGLAFLTKAEFTIALLPALAAGLLLDGRDRDASHRQTRSVLAIVASGILLPPALAFVVLWSRMSPVEALHGVLGSWNYVPDGRLRELRFYRDLQGTLDVGESITLMGAWLGRFAAVFVPAAAVAAVTRRSALLSRVVAGTAAMGSAGAVLAGWAARDWENLARPFPVILGGAAALIAASMCRRRAAGDTSRRRILGLSCIVFATLLLAKVLLHVSLLHYGFVLAMPAGIAIVSLAVGSVPAWIDRMGGGGRVFRWAAVGALAGFAVIQLGAARMWLAGRTIPVGEGRDRFWIHERDRGFSAVLTKLQQVRKSSETLAVVPEGVMLNYLLRAENPTGFVNFMPPELIMFGEARMVAAFRARPPDLIVLMNRGVLEYGYRFFGDDYGRDLYAAIEAQYDVVDRVFQLDAWGTNQPMAAILRRRDRALR